MPLEDQQRCLQERAGTCKIMAAADPGLVTAYDPFANATYTGHLGSASSEGNPYDGLLEGKRSSEERR